MTRNLPTVARAKNDAKRLRAERAEQGQGISHAQALEQVAHSYGFCDWNAFYAAIKEKPPPDWVAGGRVTGVFLSQPFAATVLSAEQIRPGWFRLVIDLDEAVDVVRFESFSNLRKRIRIVVGPEGRSKERTSDGAPHVELDL